MILLAVGADVLGIEHAMVARIILFGGSFPTEQRCLVDALRIHVGDQTCVVEAVPENVLV